MEIVTRKEWGARSPRRVSRISTPVQENWLHHTATEQYGAKGMRDIQRYHMDSKEWSDIGYSWVYDPKARIWFEGRGWGVSGAHTYGHNSVSHGFCVMGNYNNRNVTETNINDIARFIAGAYKAGHGPAEFTGGHRDVGSTSCPGNNLYSEISSINSSINTILNTKEADMVEKYDKTSSKHFQEAYNWAVDAGIFSAYTEPGDPVVAETLAVFLKRAYDKGVFKTD